jgi:hypothetical protein
VRLVTGILTLLAQVAASPWKAVPPTPDPPGPVAPGPAAAQTLSVRITADGVVRIFEAKGLRRLRIGLPGRPLQVWRDGGIPVPHPFEPLAFPTETPLRKGVGTLPLTQPDFRPALQGLLWILDDGERGLTIVHPATAQVVRLDLPPVDGPSLRFYGDHLEVGGTGQGEERVHFALPWVALLPQFLVLATPAPAPPPGTALVPFPRE